VTYLILVIVLLAIAAVIASNKALAAKLRGEWSADVNAVHLRVDAIEAQIKAKLP
jgi:hypothetical protein